MQDSLTGLLNHRGYFASVGQRLSRSASGYVAVVFLDLDRLKEINDEQGHVAGNRALPTFADALRGSFRPTDVIGRLGEGEFAVQLTSQRPVPDEVVLDRLASMLDDAEREDLPRLECSAGGGGSRAPLGQTEEPVADNYGGEVDLTAHIRAGHGGTVSFAITPPKKSTPIERYPRSHAQPSNVSTDSTSMG